jgi:predicted nucleic acid-binding Zn ribbon protein
MGRLTARWHLGDPRVHGAVFSHWSEVVGEVVGANVRPVVIRDGVLFVEVDEAAWSTEVRFFAASIVERIEARSGVRRDEPGGVREIRVQVRGGRPRRGRDD